MIKHLLKSLLALIILSGVGTALVFAFLEGRKELETEADRERPIKAPSRVTVQDGESVVTLDAAGQTRSGIVAAPLESSSHQEQVEAYGTVVDIQSLVDLRNNIAAAKAQVEKTQANLEVSRKEYNRLKALHEGSRYISDKTLQTAEATWRSNEANMPAAEEALRASERIAQQRWGSVLAAWLLSGSAGLDRLIRQQDVLIQVTLPPDMPLETAPQNASVQAKNGTFTEATLLSPSPRTDPRIQGMSLFYICPASATGFLPGMNIVARLSVGPTIEGVVVPASAVVWWQGKTWVYAQKDPERFARREISTETPIKDGWFVAKGFSAGDRLVVNGSQLLLSEEFRAQVQVGEDSNQK